MKIKISTNVKHQVHEPIKFAYQFAKAKAKQLGKHLNGVAINVTSVEQYDRGYRGSAWPTSQRILMRLAPNLPAHIHRYARYQDMPEFWISGGDESIVYLAAHEFGHCIGFEGNKIGEKQCCRLGYRAVEAWRERQYEHPACLI